MTSLLRSFNLFALILTSLFAPFGFVQEAQALDSDIDLRDYYFAEVGTTFTFAVTNTDYYEDTVETSTSEVEVVDCDYKIECYSENQDGVVNDYRYEDGEIYIFRSDGESTHRTVLYRDPFEYEWTDEQIEDAGFDPDNYKSFTSTCEVNHLEDHQHLDYRGEALQESCSTTGINKNSVDYLTSNETYYMKGIGFVESTWTTYIGKLKISEYKVELSSSSIQPDQVFSDVKSDHKNFRAINHLYQEGIVTGYSDGTFKPSNTINRAELLKILIEGQGVTPDASSYSNCFPDVTTDWYAKYVCYAKAQGWVAGYPDNTFHPGDTVNKVEALKMLLNSQDIDVEAPANAPFTDVSVSEWFAPFVAKAKEMEILEESGSTFSPDADKNRGSICENLYRLLTD